MPPEPTDAQKAFARDMERIGADFQRAFGDIGKAFESTVAGLKQSQQAPPPIDVSWVTPPPPETWLQRQPVWLIVGAVFVGITLFFGAMVAVAAASGAL